MRKSSFRKTLALMLVAVLALSLMPMSVFGNAPVPTVTIVHSDNIPTGNDLNNFNTVVYNNNTGAVVDVIVRGGGGGSGRPAWGAGTVGSRAAYIGNMNFRVIGENALVPLPVVRRLLAAAMEPAVPIAYQECPHTGLAALRIGSTTLAMQVGNNRVYFVTDAALAFPLPSNELPASRVAVAASGTDVDWIPYAAGYSAGVPIRPIIEAMGGFISWTPTVTRVYIPRQAVTVASAVTAMTPTSNVTFTPAEADNRFDTYTVPASGFVFLPGLTRGEALSNPPTNQANVRYVAFSYFDANLERRVRVEITPGGAYRIDIPGNQGIAFRFYF